MPASTLPDPMSSYEARKATFYQKDAAAGPSRKKASSASAATVWPHPIASRNSGRKERGSDAGSDNNNDASYPSPRSMAALGLYYDPTPESNDRCKVYPEGQEVCEWRQGQSVLDRLVEVDSTIPWVMIEQSKRAGEARSSGGETGEDKMVWKREEEALMPTGKAMTDARVRTFGGAWPLDGKKGWKPTSKKLSSAGFHYTPNEDEEDCVTCVYCQCSLGGWEKADDPVKEHQRRRPDCLVFTTVLEKKREPASRVASTTKSRSTSRKRAADASEDQDDEQSARSKSRKGMSASPQPEETQMAPAKPAPKKKTATGKTKRATKKAAAPAAENVEAKTKTTRTRKASAADAKSAKGQETVERDGDQMDVDEQAVEASDFEEGPSRSHSSDKISRHLADSPPTSCESETFKTPRQAVSARSSAKTPKASSPGVKTNGKPAMEGDIAPLKKLGTLSSHDMNLTVEDWLKAQVGKACVEMEAEGGQRISKLREEMNRGRIEVESILRGTSR